MILREPPVKENPSATAESALGDTPVTPERGEGSNLDPQRSSSSSRRRYEDLAGSCASCRYGMPGGRMRHPAAPLRPDSGRRRRHSPADATGRKLGIRGTPGFVLGLTDPEDSNKARVTEFINGAQSLDTFNRTIEELLKKAEEGQEGP